MDGNKRKKQAKINKHNTYSSVLILTPETRTPRTPNRTWPTRTPRTCEGLGRSKHLSDNKSIRPSPDICFISVVPVLEFAHGFTS